MQTKVLAHVTAASDTSTPCCRVGRTSKFLQSMHLQLSEQKTPAWKHSQYFFWQWLLRCVG